MQLSNWWPAHSALTFTHPWLFLLLLAIPLLAYLRGKRGPAAALTFSSTETLRAIGKQSAARRGSRSVSTRYRRRLVPAGAGSSLADSNKDLDVIS